VIEAIVDAALEKGRLKRRERRRLMSYPLVIRLMIAMALMGLLPLYLPTMPGTPLGMP
jgi:hypothetical protein